MTELSSVDHDTQAIERRTFQVAVGDGSADLVFGLALVALGVSWMLDGLGELGLAFGAWLLLRALWRRLRTGVVEPRIGHVRLHPERMRRVARARVALNAAFVLSMLALLGLKAAVPAWGPAISVVGLLFWAGLVALAGRLLEFPRLYGYGALLAGCFVAGRLAGLPHEYATIATGIVVTVLALVRVVRFIQRHPPRAALVASDG